MKTSMYEAWDNLSKMNKTRPYVFKTRLNRVLLQTRRYAEEQEDSFLKQLCDDLENRMRYISDQSNQTSDGELRSFIVLHDDILNIRNEIERQI